MKKLLLLAICTASISVYALPTYEPFTEFASAITASGSNSINLCTGGYLAPSGEAWTSMNYSGTAGTGGKGMDIYVTNYSAGSVFTYSVLSSILPTGFPGLPASGNSINILCVNPAQAGASANLVGNSAVLNFTRNITRPASGLKTLYWSYLISVAQKGQAGANNVGRYLGFVASTNLALPSATYPTWNSFFNTWGSAGTVPRYFGHGVIAPSTAYFEPPDSSAGKSPATTVTTYPITFNQPYFIVGEFDFTTGAGIADTNKLWVNPATSSFGGLTPPAPGVANTMGTVMSDVGGMVLIDRPGSNVNGGVGTNYIANLIIGSTWSYVTGGPEFTTNPPASTSVPLGGNGILSGVATAAGQSVSYRWQKFVGGTPQSLTDGSGTAGGSATVAGSGTSTLTLTGVNVGDTGDYQLVATASGTGYIMNSTTANLRLSDPRITANPANVTANYGGSASFTATVATTSAPLTYRWYLGAVPLNDGIQPDGSTATGASGTTGAGTAFTLTLTLNNVSYQEIGNYTIYVTNTGGFNNSAVPAALVVNDPYIITQPANPAVLAGGNATFTVAAAGSPTLSYQWYEGATPLSNGGTPAGGIATVSGADTATLTLTGVQDADNGSYSCAITGSASLQTANSAVAKLTVQDSLTVVSPPMSLSERVGDHVAFAVGVTGGGPQFQWSYNGNPISGATTSALVLTNIQTGSNGTYSVVVSNLATAPQTFSSTLTVINSAVLMLSQSNLIVTRVGDGAQALSGATGNTLYLDQYSPGGSYINSLQVPDEAVGSIYGTGSSASVLGSPALLVAGGGSDAGYEAMLTLSGGNQQYLCFAGYCQAYPFAGTDVTVGSAALPNPYVRGLATVNAFGIYSLAYTNCGLYSGGNHTIRSAVTSDGINFWTTGQAGGGTVKFVARTNAIYAEGSGVPSSTGVTANGGRESQIVNGALPGLSSGPNLVVSDAGFGGAANGLYAASGTPEPLANGSVAFTPLLYTGGQPGDFAFSPDNQTIYVAEAGEWTGTGPGTGGIERWDSDGSGYYNFSYILPALPGGTATNGAQGLTVDFSANATWGSGVTGAKIYATTTGAAGNSLVEIVDNGSGSTPTVLVTAGPKQALRGVRFGPAAIAPSFAVALQSQTNFPGNSVTFAVAASGSAPLYYQWSFDGTPIAGATQATFTTNSISYASAGTYSVVVSNLTTQTATSSAVLTVTAGAPTITPALLPHYTERAGDHLAFAPVVVGSLPITACWYLGGTLVQSNVVPAASSSLVLTNIQPANGGTYTLVVSNLYGHASSTGSLTVTTSPQTLSSNNLVVARVGDGAQALSGATGNTLYLDQYTPAGTLVSTTQIPDEGTGQPYGTGSANSASLPFGSPALLFAGTGSDAGYEAFLTLAPNGQTLNFAGYCQAYPFAGSDVSASGGNGGNQWRGIGTVDAYGYYTLAYTNTGLYSGGLHQIHAAVDLDGTGTNFYSVGQAGNGPGVKYCTTTFQPASGLGISSIVGSFPGTRVVQVIGGNLVFSDVGASPIGIYACAGLPTGTASATLMIAETNSPMDFAVSPDLNTVYIADNGAFVGTSTNAGGIQRWDGSGGVYTYSYTLATGAGSMVGARGLTVDFSAASTWGVGVTGAKLYATTAEPSGNRLLKIVDTGAASSATLLVAASPGQMLAGVRFGPVIVPPGFSGELQNQSALAGSAVTFSAGALGSGPLAYQWYFQYNGTGPFVTTLNATNANYTITGAGSDNVGNYYVVITNPGLLTATSPTVSFTLTAPPVPPQFTSEIYLGPGNGFQLNFTGPAGIGYTIWTTINVALSPVQSTWTMLTTGTFSGGSDTYTDPNGGTNPQQFYIISVP